MVEFEYLSVDELNRLFPEIILKIEKDDFCFSYKDINIRNFADTQKIIESNRFIFQSCYENWAYFIFETSGNLSIVDYDATYINVQIAQLEREDVQFSIVLHFEKTKNSRRYLTLRASGETSDYMLYRFKKPKNYPKDEEVFNYTWGDISFISDHHDERNKCIYVSFNEFYRRKKTLGIF